MEDFIFTPIVFTVGFVIHLSLLRRHTVQQGRLLTFAFGGHVVSAFAQVLLVLYYFPGGGDMLSYFANGVEVADVLRSDFIRFAPELLKAFLQEPNFLPVPVTGAGSTMSMSAAASFILFLTGNSLYAAVALVSVASYVSQVLIFHGLRSSFPEAQHTLVLAGCTLLPSAVFWSSALFKEPLVMSALGPLVLGLSWLAQRRRTFGAVFLLLPSVTLMAVIKPYVLMALSLAAAAFYLITRLKARGDIALKPFAVVTAAVLAVGGLVLGSRFFIQSDAGGSTAATLAAQRRIGYDIEGGSNYYLDQAPSSGVAERSMAQELALAPLALFTAFFRPFIFEARNSVQFVNALEASYILFLFIQVLRVRGWSASVGAILRSPALVFCLVFAFALALGTGLASSNMGTLSRYRAPMMPFFFTLLLVLRYGGPLASAPSTVRFAKQAHA